MYFVDLPGYGYAKTSKEQKKILIEVYNCRSKVKINYIGIRNISKKKKIKDELKKNKL